MIAETQAALSAVPRADVLAALKTASARTGSDFDYLLATAMRESRLDTHAKSTSSSASGLFQFIEQTWLGLIKRYGERYGLHDFAGAISETKNGHYEVASKEAKSAILALRQDAEISSLMAGEAAKETKQALECKLGRTVCSGELYAAHFLGEGGARQLIELNASSPDAPADVAFPQAAGANRAAFFHADGRSKSVAEVYAWTVNLPQSAKVNQSASSPQPAEAVKVANILPEASARAARQFSPASAASTPHAARALASSTRMEPMFTHTAPHLRLSPGMIELLAAFAPAQLALRQG